MIGADKKIMSGCAHCRLSLMRLYQRRRKNTRIAVKRYNYKSRHNRMGRGSRDYILGACRRPIGLGGSVRHHARQEAAAATAPLFCAMERLATDRNGIQPIY